MSDAKNFPDGVFFIRSLQNNLYLDAKGEGKSKGTPLIVWERNGNPNQQWKLSAAKRTITNVHNNLVLDARGGKGGTLVCWAEETGKKTQIFSWDGKHFISAASGFVLDIKGASNKKGAEVIAWPSNNGLNQEWEIVHLNGEPYREDPESIIEDDSSSSFSSSSDAEDEDAYEEALASSTSSSLPAFEGPLSSDTIDSSSLEQTTSATTSTGSATAANWKSNVLWNQIPEKDRQNILKKYFLQMYNVTRMERPSNLKDVMHNFATKFSDPIQCYNYLLDQMVEENTTHLNIGIAVVEQSHNSLAFAKNVSYKDNKHHGQSLHRALAEFEYSQLRNHVGLLIGDFYFRWSDSNLVVFSSLKNIFVKFLVCIDTIQPEEAEEYLDVISQKIVHYNVNKTYHASTCNERDFIEELMKDMTIDWRKRVHQNKVIIDKIENDWKQFCTLKQDVLITEFFAPESSCIPRLVKHFSRATGSPSTEQSMTLSFSTHQEIDKFMMAISQDQELMSTGGESLDALKHLLKCYDAAFHLQYRQQQYQPKHKQVTIFADSKPYMNGNGELCCIFGNPWKSSSEPPFPIASKLKRKEAKAETKETTPTSATPSPTTPTGSQNRPRKKSVWQNLLSMFSSVNSVDPEDQQI